jgi:predicted ferric reductase
MSRFKRPSAGIGSGVPARWRDTVTVTAGLSLLAVTALWVAGGGVQQLTTGGADGWTSAGRLTGLWSSDLLLIQVLLMARIPAVERVFGQDRLARWHRWTGTGSFTLLIAHLILTVGGYAMWEAVNPLVMAWRMTAGYPGMLLAAAGTALLTMVAVTSARRVRARMRYESWHLLHLYAYLGVGLGLPHQLWTGTEFTASVWARIYWWTLYTAAAVAVLIWRVGLPVWRNVRHRLVVADVRTEAPGLTSVYLRGRHVEQIPARAGQFFQWRFLDGPGWTRAHPFSLSAAPGEQMLRITVKTVGDGTTRIAALKPGTRVLIEGPYGTLTGAGYTGGPLVLLACGIGITPLISLLGELPYRWGEATLVYRARTPDEVAFKAELDWFAAQRGVRVLYAFGPRSDDGSWLPQHMSGLGAVEGMLTAAPQVADAHVFVCGPDAWARAAADAATGAGTPSERIHTELFSW